MTGLATSQIWRMARRLPDVRPLRVVPWLLMLVLLLNAPDAWYLRTPLVALAAAGMVVRRIVYAPAYWYCVATLLGATVYLNWESSDNHKYLFVYAALALCCVFSLPRTQQDEALAKTSRLLIGLCMLFATLWKLANPQYVSGGFFTYELLVDPRFAGLVSWLGDLSTTDLAANRALRELLVSGTTRGIDVTTVSLGSSTRIGLLATALTWWTVLIEGLIALLFLLPDSRRVAQMRNMALLVFGASTYCIAPVRGFGWILMLLGLGQCGERERAFRPAYLAAFVLIQVYLTPIGEILELLWQA